jgi:hypothetical protein
LTLAATYVWEGIKLESWESDRDYWFSRWPVEFERRNVYWHLIQKPIIEFAGDTLYIKEVWAGFDIAGFDINE